MAQSKSTTGTMNFYLGDLKPAWIAYCNQRGMKPGAVLKAAVQRELAGNIKAQLRGAPASKYEVPDVGPKVRVEVRLTESEARLLDRLVVASSSSRQRWIVCAVRGALTRSAQFTEDSVQALWESNRQLRAIGRNLNQLVRHLNEGNAASTSTKSITELVSVISAHTEQASRLIADSQERWVIDGSDN